jgi:hypothetical protein
MDNQITFHHGSGGPAPGGFITTVYVPPNSTVIQVKEALSEKIGLPCSNMRFVSIGRQLLNDEICCSQVVLVIRR